MLFSPRRWASRWSSAESWRSPRVTARKPPRSGSARSSPSRPGESPGTNACASTGGGRSPRSSCAMAGRGITRARRRGAACSRRGGVDCADRRKGSGRTWMPCRRCPEPPKAASSIPSLPATHFDRRCNSHPLRPLHRRPSRERRAPNASVLSRAARATAWHDPRKFSQIVRDLERLAPQICGGGESLNSMPRASRTKPRTSEHARVNFGVFFSSRDGAGGQ